MRISKSLYLLFAALLVVGMLPLTVAAQPAANIDPDLLAKLKAESTANFFVKMAVDADTSAGASMDTEAARQYVWQAVNEVANATQGPVLDFCAKNGLDCAPMLINNSVFVRGGNLDAANGLAALPGVAYLRLERILAIPDPADGGAGIQGFMAAAAEPDATTDWGILDTKADQFWSSFGVQGDGIKVANIDTGVQWNHPALDQAFACPGDPSNPNCWADPSNICGGSACDNQGHGSHTMGTMVADDDPSLTYIAGMAPNATWIACKGCESNSCSEFALTTCATWILAPGGDPANAPDVVNNSWGGGTGDPWYMSYVQNWVNAQIFPAFSAGNNGPSCSSLGSPGDYQVSFGSAAHASGRAIASFSSRGPSAAFGHDPYTKPNISAPGVSVCSSVPTNGWSCGYSGTSMASPHSAGAVALLWSCNPDLVGQIDATFQLLQNTADVPPAGTCGAPPDGQGNYTFGYGYLNVLAAGMQACGQVDIGTLDGHVYDQYDQPVEGATVTAQGTLEGAGINATTGPDGYYTMDLVVGIYDVTASKLNYTSQTVTGVEVLANQTTTQDFTIDFLGAWTQITLPAGCPDWTRIDAEYVAATGKAYILGGRGGADGTSTFGDIYAFDPAAQTCADTGANMLTPISNYTIAPIDGLLCTFGGRDSTGAMILKTQCYDPIANTVVYKADLPTTFTGYLVGGVAGMGGKAWVFGGFNSLSAPYNHAYTYEYDLAANTFTQKGNISLARAYIDVAVVDGLIYGFGGDTYDGASLYATTKAEVYDPALGAWNDAAVADLATASGEGRAYGFDAGSGYEFAGKIIIAGGGQWPSQSADVLAYDIATDSYDTGIPDLNIMRRNHAGFFVPGDPGKMWVFGGRSDAAGYGGDLPPYAPPEYYEVAGAGADQFLHINKTKINQRPAAQPGYYKAIFLLRVHDQDHNLVAGADSWGTWTFPDGSTEYQQAIMLTDDLGRTKFRVKKAQCGTYGFCVDTITKAGYVYDPGANDWPACLTIEVPCK